MLKHWRAFPELLPQSWKRTVWRTFSQSQDDGYVLHQGPKGIAGSWRCLSSLCRVIPDVLRQTLNRAGRGPAHRYNLKDGWQMGFFFSQVIVSGWVIYGSATRPQVSQMPAEGSGSSVHSEILFPHLSRSPGWCIHLRAAELSHNVCCRRGGIDLAYGSF